MALKKEGVLLGRDPKNRPVLAAIRCNETGHQILYELVEMDAERIAVLPELIMPPSLKLPAIAAKTT